MDNESVKKMLSEIVERVGFDKDQVLPQSVQAKRLIAAFKRYKEEYVDNCPFVVGELVTPRADSTLKGQGQPHIIVAMTPAGQYAYNGNPGSTGFGRGPNIRVLCMDGEVPVPFWCESWEFEKWGGTIAA